MAEVTTHSRFAQTVMPGTFEAHRHWYPRALNATIHPMVNFFLNLEQERIIKRYCHLHPGVRQNDLAELLHYQPWFFHWAGADLINVTNIEGKRHMVVIENNSCPSGQKSMPLTDDHQERGAYRWLIEKTFKPIAERKRLTVQGALAVVFDKNPMENTGYAAVMADLFNEPVYCVEFHHDDPDPPVRFEEGIMFVRDQNQQWNPIRAAFRYVTQKPWNRIPIQTRTRIMNPIVACIAGGRNKMLAAKAYDKFNKELKEKGLHIHTPYTIRDVRKEEIPGIVKTLGGQAVVKVPYSNAGQGVFTIVSKKELDDFMKRSFDYDRFIVQSLIGNYHWSSTTSRGRLFHVGTIPSPTGETFVCDVRMMVSSTDQGIRPLCVYARRAEKPLADHISDSANSWAMLGTNLSFRKADGSWDTDTNRLLLMDRRDFNRLGLGLDDLIEAYIQTLLSMIAIDQMAKELIGRDGRFKWNTFKKLNDDLGLLEEIKAGNELP
ncbi:MAG: hypothetical protein KatS3mg030_656 [Saprospiraceae bacterium]|nr:MAG: hypothetical protein KatS3mg030_656 [Saprospiraceae bacterium]